MKAFTGFQKLSTWFLRIGMLAAVYLYFGDTLMQKPDFGNLNYIIVLVAAIFSVLLFIGGFLKKESLTVFSALILIILSIIAMITIKNAVAMWLLPLLISLFFFAYGNRH